MQISTLHVAANLHHGFPIVDAQGSHDERWKEGAGEHEFSRVPPPAPRALQAFHERPQLLQVSHESALADSRKALLQRVGFQVETKSSVNGELSRGAANFAVLLICQSVSLEQAFAAINRFSQMDVPPATVRVTRDPGLCAGSFDLVLQSPVMPQIFVNEMRNLYALTQLKQRGSIRQH